MLELVRGKLNEGLMKREVRILRRNCGWCNSREGFMKLLISVWFWYEVPLSWTWAGWHGAAKESSS
jgi:hypothetical protein